jgi:hypothetical protein
MPGLDLLSLRELLSLRAVQYCTQSVKLFGPVMGASMKNG